MIPYLRENKGYEYIMYTNLVANSRKPSVWKLKNH